MSVNATIHPPRQRQLIAPCMLVGTTRESIDKQLRQWTEAGVVRIDDGYVVILSPVELEKLAGAVLY